MRYIFNFPDIGEGLDEGTIAEWYIEKGQLIESGSPVVKMETDKVVTDIPSPKGGRVVALYGKAGEIVKVGSPLVEIEIEGVDGEAAVSEAKENVLLDKKEEGVAVVGTMEVAPNTAYMPASLEGLSSPDAVADKGTKKAIATPVARAMAKELGIDINQVTGTGTGSRVVIEDIKKFHESFQAGIKTKTTAAEGFERISIEPLSQIRKAIARNMIASKQNVVPMVVFEEVDVGELIRIREKFKTKYEERGVKLTYLAFIVKAVAMALKKHRQMNSQLDLENEKIIYKNYYNIGIAVDTEEGLVVPVLQDADKTSVFEIASGIQDLSTRARERKLKLEELKDGTFTITSYGSIGGIFAAPVINYPQVGILGVGRIIKKPVVVDDQIVIGTILPLSLVADHRIIDGGVASRFVNDLMGYLKEPVSIIME